MPFITQIKKSFTALCFGFSTLVCTSVTANDFIQHPDYSNFKANAKAKYGLTDADIDIAMQGSQNLPRILALMSKPGESKPWYQYRQMFLVESTIQRGVRFQRQYSAALLEAEQKYGVPQSIILGVLGVETGFGTNKGSFVARDALATLGFGLPHRAAYFQDELAALIAWTKKEQYSTNTIVGSYAGAIGYPQFMPSNILKLGVDFDGDGHIDLRNSARDAIGSIAHYLSAHGWQPDRPIAFQARYTGQNPEEIIAKDLTKPQPYGVLQKQGISPMDSIVKIDNLDMVNVIKLDESHGPIYYITYPNYQVITTYNRSRLYATAVWKLGTEIMTR